MSEETTKVMIKYLRGMGISKDKITNENLRSLFNETFEHDEEIKREAEQDREFIEDLIFETFETQ